MSRLFEKVNVSRRDAAGGTSTFLFCDRSKLFVGRETDDEGNPKQDSVRRVWTEAVNGRNVDELDAPINHIYLIKLKKVKAKGALPEEHDRYFGVIDFFTTKPVDHTRPRQMYRIKTTYSDAEVIYDTILAHMQIIAESSYNLIDDATCVPDPEVEEATPVVEVEVKNEADDEAADDAADDDADEDADAFDDNKYTGRRASDTMWENTASPNTLNSRPFLKAKRPVASSAKEAAKKAAPQKAAPPTRENKTMMESSIKRLSFA